MLFLLLLLFLFAVVLIMSDMLQIRESKDNTFVFIITKKKKKSHLFNSPQILVSTGTLSTHLSSTYISVSQKYHSLFSIK